MKPQPNTTFILYIKVQSINFLYFQPKLHSYLYKESKSLHYSFVNKINIDKQIIRTNYLIDMFKGITNFFKGKDNQADNFQKAQSRLKGKMIKDYTLQDKITQFRNPQTELVLGLRQNSQRVSIYALQKKFLTQQSFISYQNTLANNHPGIYPQYLQHIQSSNFIYIVFQQLSLPQNKSWMAQDLLDQIQAFSLRTKQKLCLNGILVNNKKKLAYLPPYQDGRNLSKIYYQGINKPVFAELFCKVLELPQKQNRKVYDTVVLYAETNSLKTQVLKLLTSLQRQAGHNKYGNRLKTSNQSMLKYPQQTKFNQPTQINTKTQESLYPDISAEDEQIMKLISVVRINPNLIQQASNFNQMRASSRARHQNDEQTKQIKNVIDNANRSMFQINKVVKKSGMKSKYQIKQNQNKISQNQFQLYCTTYISTFKQFKRTVKSSLTFYGQGFSGIINAYFITLIGILRRSKLVYALSYQQDIFGIGCESVNVEFYTSKLKKQLVSQAKILTDLRQMIFRCYIPIKTFQILSPYLDDHIQNIDLTKLQDFCFFYMTSLMRNSFQKNVHYVNAIQIMYIILHRNFQIVHFQNDVPKKWDEDYFQLRKQLIQAMIPDWNI